MLPQLRQKPVLPFVDPLLGKTHFPAYGCFADSMRKHLQDGPVQFFQLGQFPPQGFQQFLFFQDLFQPRLDRFFQKAIFRFLQLLVGYRRIPALEGLARLLLFAFFRQPLLPFVLLSRGFFVCPSPLTGQILWE